MIHIEHFTFNSFQTRCCVVWDDTLECAIVDPGCSAPSEIAALTSFIDSHGLKPVCIMLTHGHFDHVLGVAELASRYGIPVYMHPDDKFTLENNEYFCKWFGAPLPAAFETVDVREAAGSDGGCLSDGGDDAAGAESAVKVGGLRFQVIETPGHTVGGVCYYEPDEKVLFSGDTLFAGAIGRTSRRRLRPAHPQYPREADGPRRLRNRHPRPRPMLRHRPRRHDQPLPPPLQRTV